MMNNPWEQITPPQKDLSARRVDHTHPLDLFWARDHLGAYLFVYECGTIDTNIPTKLPALVGMKAFFIKARESTDKNRFVLLLNERGKWEIFLALCNDLVQATSQAKTASVAVEIFLRRLVHWQEFLKKIRPDILSEDQIKGLIGELLFMKKHLVPAFGISQTIKFWQGPEGLPQDFNVDNSAIEVKCQSGSTSPRVRITSEDQLCPQLPEMYLYVITLGKTSPDNKSAVNLPTLINYFRGRLETEGNGIIEHFNDLLHKIGYIDSDLYLEYSYIFADEDMFGVVEGFPKICRDDIPKGIDRLSYYIQLAACKPFKKTPDWMRV